VPPRLDVRAWVRFDPARACLAALVLADIAIVWSLPVLVGQDLPQHLSYARILADYADPRLPFRDTFVLPAHAQPYFTAYIVLALLTRLSSVLTACRIVYTAYVIAMAAGFSSLVAAVHATERAGADAPRPKTPWTSLFGPLLAWNPVQCVGFLPFMLALPAVLFGAAAVVRTTGGRSRRPLVVLALAAAAATSLHFVAAACLGAFAMLYAIFRPSLRGLLATAVTVGAALLTVVVWHRLGDRGLAEFPSEALAAAIRRSGLYDGTVQTLGIQWNTFETKGAFIVATVLGPLPRDAKVLIGVAIVSLSAVVWSARKQRVASVAAPASGLPYGLAVLAFFGLAVATPAAIRLPEDICLVDFRLYVIAFMLALALVDARWFDPRPARVGVALFGALVLAVWGRQLAGAAGEATAVLRLVERLEPTRTVLALPFHDRSEFLDENNSVTHYFPVYYTALRGGVTSLFWGKFSRHLPVGYRDGREPLRPPDWDPSRFTRAELLATSNVLVEWPDPDDGDLPVSGAARLRDELARGFTAMGCEGRWCLYQSPGEDRSDRREMAEARR
jgi:hypothetical protein